MSNLFHKPGELPKKPHPVFRRPGRPLGDAHHLDRHNGGNYRFKITLVGTERELGKRVTIPLRTRDLTEAQARAEIVRDVLTKTGALPFFVGDNSSD